MRSAARIAASGPRTRGDDVAGREPAAVGDAEVDAQGRVDERRRGREGGGAGEHARLAGDDAREAVAGEGRAGDVAVAGEVFGQRGARRGARRLARSRARSRALHLADQRRLPAREAAAAA